jgi:predicted AAA+ superfamily ATPase
MEIYYYKNGIEVDFLIREKLEIKQLVQVCYNLEDPDTKEREIKALLKASMELKCQDLLIITWDREEEERIGDKKVVYLPLWKWLLK